VKVNLKGLPKENIFPKKGPNKKDRGVMTMVKALISGVVVYFTSWMESKPVYGLSTLPTDKDIVQRKEKNSAGQFTLTSIWRPTMWSFDNLGMGGTDLYDQLNQYYRTMVRCNRWPIRIFNHFLHSAVTNAYILYREKNNLQAVDLSLQEFISILLDDIAALPDDPDAKEEVVDDVDHKERKFTKTSGWANPVKKKPDCQLLSRCSTTLFKIQTHGGDVQYVKGME
jgi:hypothetical protein